MPDNTHDKVISIFQRHKQGEHFHFQVEDDGELIISPDGFNYVSFKIDKHSQQGDAETVLDVAHAKHYIFNILEEHKDMCRLSQYYIPGDKLAEFIATIPQRPGRVIEIKPFIPDGMA